MAEPSDLELIRDLRAAHRAVRERAFTALFVRHGRRAQDLAFRVLGDAGLAADVVQEVFLSLFLDGVRFEARAQFTSWLYRVVLNRSIDLRRGEKRRGRRGIGTTGEPRAGESGREAVAGAADGPDVRLEAAERAAAVREAIGELSPKLAEVVVLRYLQDLGYEEIGRILEVPPGTVKSRLSRAHEDLRSLLGDWLDDV
jgi:RNA polymerase sigma-70 factor (ECF subfamily)